MVFLKSFKNIVAEQTKRLDLSRDDYVLQIMTIHLKMKWPINWWCILCSYFLFVYIQNAENDKV